MRAEVIHVSNGNVGEWLPTYLERVRAFGEENGTDADMGTMLATLAAEAMNPRPARLMILGLDHGMQPCGHLLASVDNYFGSVICYVLHAHLDREILNAGPEDRLVLTAECLSITKRWASGWGAKKMRIWALNDGLAALFSEPRYGFELSERRLLEQTLEEGTDG